jgi:hypothetical protein
MSAKQTVARNFLPRSSVSSTAPVRLGDHPNDFDFGVAANGRGERGHLKVLAAASNDGR